jgi:hypothetical protein
MTPLEDRLRGELRHFTDQVQPDHLRPLTVAERHSRPRRWLLPSVAAAGVAACVAVALLVASTIAVPRPDAGPTAPGGMPRYYVTLSGDSGIVVHDSRDGHVTGTTTVAGSEWTEGCCIEAGSDDRTFIAVSGPRTVSPSRLRVYRLSVTASGGIGEVTDLGSFSLAAQMRNDIALSPDAGMLAVPLFFGVKQLFSAATEVGLAVINLATRQIRTWSTRDAGGYWPGTPTWGATDATVTFPWLHTTSARTDSYALTGLRQLDVNAPGANLLSSRLVSFPAAVPASSGLPAFGNARSTIITADGGHDRPGRQRAPDADRPLRERARGVHAVQ